MACAVLVATPRAVGRHVKLAWTRRDQQGVLACQNLAADADDPVSMMVVKVVGKDLLPHSEVRMIALVLTRRARKCQTHRTQLGLTLDRC